MQSHTSNKRGEVLVAIMNSPADFEIAGSQRWYRIPVDSVPKRWPPQWVAFYQTKIFGDEAYAVRYYARVQAVKTAMRRELFPDELKNPKSKRLYFQLMLEPLEQLSAPIFSRRFRRLVFIPTTWEKFTQAVEINDLYDESPLEDRLWAEFKRLQISAERQYYLQINHRNYCLDFALFCRNGKLDIETDGDTWHRIPKRIAEDNQRNNDVVIAGWYVLRFNSTQINEAITDYCIPTISDSIKQMGGVEGTPPPPALATNQPEQLGLFDDNFNQMPEETYSYSENSATKIANIQSVTPFHAIPAMPPLQKEEQAELFREMPKSKKRKRQKRKL